MPLFDRLSRWFFPRQRRADVGVSIDDRNKLRQEQRELADEIESLFRVFDDRLQQLAQRTHGLSAAEFSREASRIRSAQDELRRALRRLEASVKSSSQLQKELEQWERLPSEGELHADHPTIRAELIRSELAVRSGQVRASRGPSKDDRPVKDVVALLKQQLEEDVLPENESVEEQERVEEDGSSLSEYQFQNLEPLPQVDPLHLVRCIREATHEAERWHAVPQAMIDDDALVQLHHVRELHALLKRIDRARGVRRDRIALAVSLSDAAKE